MAGYEHTQQIQATMARLLGVVNERLYAFLESILPSLYEDWWKQCVIKCLSVPQIRHVERHKIASLGEMDLATLLRVFDRNWYEISSRLSLPREALHFVKEMQTIRNRWAHANAEGYPLEDVYRDLDTLQRFAVVIGAEDSVVQEIRAVKKSLLATENEPVQTEGKRQTEQTQKTGETEIEFQEKQIVCLKSDTTKRGAILSVLPGSPENRYSVFMDGEIHDFYASQLKADDSLDKKVAPVLVDCEQFHARLTALQIMYPGLSTLYSLNAARIDFIPYQFRPVLRFIRSDRPRLLIADGVGVGKTIEAGLILRELQARRDIRSILIICPRPLVTEKKWMNEMKRFEERFTHLDGPTLRYCMNEMDLDGAWPAQHEKAILPYSLFDEDLLYGSGPKKRGKRKRGLLELDPPPRFDLVIVDEAHHIRNTNTFTHKAVRFFCDHAEAVVFLTATPIQLGDHDLFVLLNTLRPDLIIDEGSYKHMAEPNPFINQAVSAVRTQEANWIAATLEALEQAAETPWGEAILRKNPVFIQTQNLLAQGTVIQEERVRMITDIEAMHTFSGIINRTRRRDIGDFTVRKPETVAVEFTPEQREFHDELLRVQAEILGRLHANVSIKFMMTTIRRQAASCLFGLVPLLNDILNRHVDELFWDEVDDREILPDSDAAVPIQEEIQSILECAKVLNPYDPKLEALRTALRKRQNRPNNKVMLFSSFRHTLKYLYNHLREDGLRVGMVHGNTPDEERLEMRNRFEKPREDKDCLDILLFSEIGCEGLDYQFCDCMINYDLPWNPMRVEQRIGRIDRNGQKSESVAIINMVTPDTVDADIYYRCLLRIGIFEKALGGSEEILGEITREMRDIGEDGSLTEEERHRKLDQLADNKIRRIQEEEKLEERQVELFGIRLPEGQMQKEIEDAASFWLSPESIQNFVKRYLQEKCGKEQDVILGEKPLKTLRLAQEVRALLLEDFQTIPRQTTVAYREWENWLKGGEQHLAITFEAGCASENPKAAFIMPLHPLVKQAARALDTGERAVTSLKVQSDEAPAGSYEFAIYQWRFHGIREDQVLQPIASSSALTPLLGNLLKKAVDAGDPGMRDGSTTHWDALDGQHYTLWSEARDKHAQRTRELAAFRRESLSTSHKARINLLQEQLDQATNEKIRRMRESQIASAEADYARRIQELDIAAERADIIAEPVAYGIIIVKGEIQNA